MAFTYIGWATLWLVVFTSFLTSPALAIQTKNTTTPGYLLEKTLNAIKPLPASQAKENILIEIGFESYLLNKKVIFDNTMLELEKTNSTLTNAFPKGLKKLSSLIKNKKNTPSILNNSFSNITVNRLAQEELFLNSIRKKTIDQESLINTPLNNKPFNDSLQWNAAYIYYLTLTQDVSLKKSTNLKRFLIKQLAKSPPQQHQKRNLEISLLETLGGAIKQGEETRLISNINGFSPHNLVQLNQRILFYQQFIAFYNARVGLNRDQCNTPLSITSNSLDTFFSLENVKFVKQLESLTIKEPNDYLLASIIIEHLDSCTPLSKIFQRRSLRSLEKVPFTTNIAIPSARNIIHHLRSLRRYTKMQ